MIQNAKSFERRLWTSWENYRELIQRDFVFGSDFTGLFNDEFIKQIESTFTNPVEVISWLIEKTGHVNDVIYTIHFNFIYFLFVFKIIFILFIL